MWYKYKNFLINYNYLYDICHIVYRNLYINIWFIKYKYIRELISLYICIYTYIRREVNSINFVNIDSKGPQLDICHPMMIPVPRMGYI